MADKNIIKLSYATIFKITIYAVSSDILFACASSIKKHIDSASLYNYCISLSDIKVVYEDQAAVVEQKADMIQKWTDILTG